MRITYVLLSLMAASYHFPIIIQFRLSQRDLHQTIEHHLHHSKASSQPSDHH